MGALVLAVHAVAPGGIGSIPSGAAVAALGLIPAVEAVAEAHPATATARPSIQAP